jgi:hypothetical protein
MSPGKLSLLATSFALALACRVASAEQLVQLPLSYNADVVRSGGCWRCGADVYRERKLNPAGARPRRGGGRRRV